MSEITYLQVPSLPPATKLRQGNVFTSVCHSVHREGCLADTPPLWTLGRHPPVDPGQTPPWADIHNGQTPLPPGQKPPWADTPPGRRLLQRTVHILLECILVQYGSHFSGLKKILDSSSIFSIFQYLLKFFFLH